MKAKLKKCSWFLDNGWIQAKDGIYTKDGKYEIYNNEFDNELILNNMNGDYYTCRKGIIYFKDWLLFEEDEIEQRLKDILVELSVDATNAYIRETVDLILSEIND